MKKYFLTAALIVAAAASVALVSCKKDNENTPMNPKQSENAALLNRIEDFQVLRNEVHSGMKADGTMTVEEMRQILDLTTNYEHSKHETWCLNTTLDTLRIAMPAVDGNGNVSKSDVVATYDALEIALEKSLNNATDGLDVPSYFAIMMPETGTKDGEINVVFNRGEETEDEHVGRVPFTGDDDWIWGLGLGLCEPGQFNCASDAAQELSRLFKFVIDEEHEGLSYILSNVEHGKYSPFDTIMLEDYVFFEDPNILINTPKWLYFITGQFGDEPCIGHDELNDYWLNIHHYVADLGAPLNIGPTYGSPYHQCNILSHIFLRRTARIHLADVVYCNITWSAHSQYDD